MDTNLDDQEVAFLTIDIDSQALLNLDALTGSMRRLRVDTEAVDRHTGNVSERLLELSGSDLSLGGTSAPGAVGSTLSSTARPQEVASAPLDQGSMTSRLEEVRRGDPELFENLLSDRQSAREEFFPRGGSSRQEGGSFDSPPRDDTKSRRSAPSDGGESPTPGGALSETFRKASDPQTLETTSRLAQSILGETRAGGSFSQTAATVGESLGDLAQSGALSSASPALLKTLGGVGAALTAGVLANQIIQTGGQQIQEFRNMGSVQGGGASEGIAYEGQIRSMALNPFLTTEQSRRIVMSALSEGYTGKEFDTVTEYMSENLKEMNLGVAESTNLLKKNVQEGGQSIKSLSQDLSVIKALTSDSTMSLEERQGIYQQTSGTFIDLGAGGGQSSTEAMVGLGIFDDVRGLEGVMSQIMSAGAPSLVSRANKAAGNPYMGTEQAMATMIEDNTYSESVLQVLGEMAQKYRGRDIRDARVFFAREVASVTGVSLTPNQAEELLEQLLSTDDPREFARDSRSEVLHEQSGVVDADEGFGRSLFNIVDGTFDIFGSVIDDVMNWRPGDELFGRTRDSSAEFERTRLRHESGSQIRALETLYDEYGARNVEVIDSEGNVVETGLLKGDEVDEYLNRVSSGEYRVRVNGEEFTIDEGTGLMESGALGPTRSSTDEGDEEESSEVTVHIEPTDELRRYFNFNTTQNSMQADAGYGGATRQTPPPGDR